VALVDLVCLYHRGGLVVDGTMMSTWGGASVSIASQMQALIAELRTNSQIFHLVDTCRVSSLGTMYP
jgi:hypothetical protein